MGIQERIVKFITATNWILLGLTSLVGFFLMPPAFARGVAFGGLIVTVNFHLLSRTLKKAFSPPHVASVNAILAKYYIRFIHQRYHHILSDLDTISSTRIGLFVGLVDRRGKHLCWQPHVN